MRRYERVSHGGQFLSPGAAFGAACVHAWPGDAASRKRPTGWMLRILASVLTLVVLSAAVSARIACPSLFVSLMPVPAFAAESGVDITTEVPATHAMTLSVGTGGSVEVDGVSYDGKATVEVPRLEDCRVRIVSGSAYEIDRVLLDGLDVTAQVIDGVLVIEGVIAEHRLEVSFRLVTGTSSGTSTGNGPSDGKAEGRSASPRGGALAATGDPALPLLMGGLVMAGVSVLVMGLRVRR